MATISDSLSILEYTTSSLRQVIAPLGDAALDFRPTADAWTVREVLAHLVDDEAFIMRLRLARIVKEDRPELVSHDEQKWYTHRNTARDARDVLLADFETQRAASLGVISLLQESDWQRVGYQPEYGEFTAAGWLERWADHDNVHLNQINETLLTYQQQTSSSL